MNTSELIAQLKRLKAMHGDLVVRIPVISPDNTESDNEVEIAGVARHINDTNEIDSFLICDESLLDAFRDEQGGDFEE